ncbi:reverse transcriptase domain-containing protein [Tanacetum coccineum]
MVDSQPSEEGAQGEGVKVMGEGSLEGPSKPAPFAQETPSPAFVKENIDALSQPRRSMRLQSQSKSKEKLRRGRTKSRRRKPEYQEISSDSESEGDSISRFKYHRRAKLPRNITVYDGNKDPRDHLSIFSAAVEQEEWLMPVWCKMFRQTLGGAAQNWFNDLDPKSMNSFEELSQKFLEEFSQKKRYAKYLKEIHGIKKRPNKGLQAFMDRFKFKISHIKGVPPVLHILAFMHGHEHPELAKKLNDKIPKTVDEIFERVRAFIRGEVATGSAKIARSLQWDRGSTHPSWSGGQERHRGRSGPKEFRRNISTYAPYSRRYTFTPLTKTPKKILAIESVSFLPRPPLIGTPEKHNLSKFCDYHEDRGHNINDCYHLKRQIEEVVASAKLAHLVKDIHWRNQRGGGSGKGHAKVINMVTTERNCKRPHETGCYGMMEEISFSPIPHNRLANKPIILEGTIKGYQSRLRKPKTPLVGFSGEFAIVRCRSPYNVIIMRTGMKSLGAIGIREHVVLWGKNTINQRPKKEPAFDPVAWECDMPGCRKELEEIHRAHADVFTWATTVVLSATPEEGKEPSSFSPAERVITTSEWLKETRPDPSTA